MARRLVGHDFVVRPADLGDAVIEPRLRGGGCRGGPSGAQVGGMEEWLKEATEEALAMAVAEKAREVEGPTETEEERP